MSADRWQTVKNILYSVIEIEPQDRERFLEQQCNGDLSLIKEVKELLKLEEQVAGFLEKPIHKASPPHSQDLLKENKTSSTKLSSSHNLDNLIGQALADFLIEEKIGEGGFGVVYKAKQVTLDRDVVIKVLHTKHQSNQQIIKRFKQEAYLASRLEHPYAAHIYAFGVEDNGLMWIAMEMVNGTPLNKYLESNGPIVLDRFVPLFDKISEVIHTAHEKNIIHRDIKPANVMLIVRAGRLMPKLLDFGIAKVIDVNNSTSNENEIVLESAIDKTVDSKKNNKFSATRTLTDNLPAFQTLPNISNSEITVSIPVVMGDKASQTCGILGSPAYMAPEQWQNISAGTRTDIYALGVLSYKALTGKLPFSGKNYLEIAQAHLYDNIPLLSASYPIKLNRVLAKAWLKKQKKDMPLLLSLPLHYERL